MISFTANLDGIDWEMLKADLIEDNFHNGRTTHQLQLSFENSQFVAMAFNDKRCVANGRMLSDGVGNSFIVDVWTHSSYRNQGIGRQIMKMLIDSVPGQHIYLQSDDAVEFYEKIGFSKQPEGLSIISGTYLDNETRQGTSPTPSSR